MVIKADLEGLCYTFLKWKSFYTNFKRVIKIALQKWRGRNGKWRNLATFQQKPKQKMPSHSYSQWCTCYHDEKWCCWRDGHHPGQQLVKGNLDSWHRRYLRMGKEFPFVVCWHGAPPRGFDSGLALHHNYSR